MQYYNLKVVTLLKNDINNIEVYEKLSKIISKAMLKDKYLRELHEKNEYKNYVFCNLYPVEKNGIYKKGSMYTFDVRFIDLKFAAKIKQLLEKNEDEKFKIIMSKLETNVQRNIKKLITLTPAVITTQKGDYLINNDLELVKTRVLANIQKKYKQLYEETVNVDFIKDIKQINDNPIKIPYKNINILGNKFEIAVKEDQMSQNLAYLALAIGLLEKNAEGFGFCMAR